MDSETRQWIVDRVMWTVGIAVSVLVSASAFAAEADPRVASSTMAVAAATGDAPCGQ